ncbi:FMP27 domain-containing protein [Rozella allomycis CSF55]|uniref:FMP27 domain-containing protein n=1 Tax=Rozella allomycis (strain CSF55) TaxID=988480 RepID=A0A075ANR0_ROZAC|nr:FMP27 domain-containing protein [Rozella allomycis CSF55]|eukprot:EPZ31555.1 FMP27 domain-containing protein [Rozella allomycis CSF55]
MYSPLTTTSGFEDVTINLKRIKISIGKFSWKVLDRMFNVDFVDVRVTIVGGPDRGKNRIVKFPIDKLLLVFYYIRLNANVIRIRNVGGQETIVSGVIVTSGKDVVVSLRERVQGVMSFVNSRLCISFHVGTMQIDSGMKFMEGKRRNKKSKESEPGFNLPFDVKVSVDNTQIKIKFPEQMPEEKIVEILANLLFDAAETLDIDIDRSKLIEYLRDRDVYDNAKGVAIKIDSLRGQIEWSKLKRYDMSLNVRRILLDVKSEIEDLKICSCFDVTQLRVSSVLLESGIILDSRVEVKRVILFVNESDILCLMNALQVLLTEQKLRGIKSEEKVLEFPFDSSVVMEEKELYQVGVMDVNGLNLNCNLTPNVDGNMKDFQVVFDVESGLCKMSLIKMDLNFDCLKLSTLSDESEKYIFIKNDLLYIIKQTDEIFGSFDLYLKSTMNFSSFGVKRRPKRRSLWIGEWINSNEQELIKEKEKIQSIFHDLKIQQFNLKFNEKLNWLNFIKGVERIKEFSELFSFNKKRKSSSNFQVSFPSLTIEFHPNEVVDERLITSSKMDVYRLKLNDVKVWKSVDENANVLVDEITVECNDRRVILCEMFSMEYSIERIDNNIEIVDLILLKNILEKSELQKRKRIKFELIKTIEKKKRVEIDKFKTRIGLPFIEEQVNYDKLVMNVEGIEVDVDKRKVINFERMIVESEKMGEFKKIIEVKEGLINDCIKVESLREEYDKWEYRLKQKQHVKQLVVLPSNSGYKNEMIEIDKIFKEYENENSISTITSIKSNWFLYFQEFKFIHHDNEPIGYLFDQIGIIKRIIVKNKNNENPVVNLQIQIKKFLLDIKDNKFESNLNKIFKINKKHQKERISREKAFWRQVEKMDKVETEQEWNSEMIGALNSKSFYKKPLAYSSQNVNLLLNNPDLFQTFYLLEELNSNLYIKEFKHSNNSNSLTDLKEEKEEARDVGGLDDNLDKENSLNDLFKMFNLIEKNVEVEEFNKYSMAIGIYLRFKCDLMKARFKDYPMNFFEFNKLDCYGGLVVVEEEETKENEYYNRTCLSTKIFNSVIINVYDKASIVWGISIDPVLSQLIKSFSLFTRESLEISPNLSFWDKMRFLLHSFKSNIFFHDLFSFYILPLKNPYNISESLIVRSFNLLSLVYLKESEFFIKGKLSCFVKTSTCPMLSVSLYENGFAFLLSDQKSVKSKFSNKSDHISQSSSGESSHHYNHFPFDEILVLHLDQVFYSFKFDWKSRNINHSSIKLQSNLNVTTTSNITNSTTSNPSTLGDSFEGFRSNGFSVTIQSLMKSENGSSRLCWYPELHIWFKKFINQHLNYRNIVNKGRIDFKNDSPIFIQNKSKVFKFFYYLSDVYINLDIGKLNARYLCFEDDGKYLGFIFSCKESEFLFHISHTFQSTIQNIQIWDLQHSEIKIDQFNSAYILPPGENGLDDESIDASVEFELSGTCLSPFLSADEILYFSLFDYKTENSSNLKNSMSFNMDDFPFFKNKFIEYSNLIEKETLKLQDIDPYLQLEEFSKIKNKITTLVDRKSNLQKYVYYCQNNFKRHDHLLEKINPNLSILYEYSIKNPKVWYNEHCRFILFRVLSLDSSSRLNRFHMTTAALRFIQEALSEINSKRNSILSINSQLGLSDDLLKVLSNEIDIDSKENSEPQISKESDHEISEITRVKIDNLQFLFQNPTENSNNGHVLLLSPETFIESNILSENNAKFKRTTKVNFQNVSLFVSTDIKYNQPQFIPQDYIVGLTHDTLSFQRVSNRIPFEFTIDSFYDSFKKKHNDFSFDNVNSFYFLAPKIQVTCSSQQYTILYDIITKLIIYRDPVKKQEVDEMNMLILTTDTFDSVELMSEMSKLQYRIRQLFEMLKLDISNIFTNNDIDFNSEAYQKWLSVKQSYKEAQKQLSVIVEAFKTILYRKKHQSSLKPSSNNTVIFRDFTWDMIKDSNEAICTVSVLDSDFQWTYFEDNSVKCSIKVKNLFIKNRLRDSLYEDILSPLETINDYSLFISWKELAPVGGISILEHLNINLSPLKIQLYYTFSSLFMHYVYPERKKKETFDTKDLTTVDSISVVDANANKMKSRASRNRIFVHVKIDVGSHRLTYRGRKQNFYIGIQGSDVQLVGIHYDILKTLISHTGSLVKEKFKKFRRTKNLSNEDDSMSIISKKSKDADEETKKARLLFGSQYSQ